MSLALKIRPGCKLMSGSVKGEVIPSFPEAAKKGATWLLRGTQHIGSIVQEATTILASFTELEDTGFCMIYGIPPPLPQDS